MEETEPEYRYNILYDNVCFVIFHVFLVITTSPMFTSIIEERYATT